MHRDKKVASIIPGMNAEKGFRLTRPRPVRRLVEVR
jgi:hypothetical protein